MDMIPLSKDYFVNKLKNYEDDKFVIFRSGQRSKTCCLYAGMLPRVQLGPRYSK